MRIVSLWIALFVLLCGLRPMPGYAAARGNDPSVLSEREVRSAVTRFLAEKLEGRGWQTTIAQLSFPQGIRLPKGTRELELIAPSSWDGWGPVSLALVVRVNGEIQKNLPLRLQVDARTDMVVATRQLMAGTVLAADDLQLQQRDVAQAGGLQIREISEAVGKKLRTMARSGAPIRSNQLEKVPVVRGGQLVTILAESAGLRISVTGRAKSSGGIGDLIRVENLSSHREIPARVIDATTVEAAF